MSLRTSFMVFVIWLMSVSAVIASPGMELCNQKIVDVRVQGNRSVSEPQILGMAKTKKGDLCNPQTLRVDAQLIFSLNKFTDVTPDLKKDPGGVIVTFKVVESSVTAKPLEKWAQEFDVHLLPQNGSIECRAGQTCGFGYSVMNKSSKHWLWAYAPRLSSTLDERSGNCLGKIQGNVEDALVVLAPGKTQQMDFSKDKNLFNFTPPAASECTGEGGFALDLYWYDNDPWHGGKLIDSSSSQVEKELPFKVHVIP